MASISSSLKLVLFFILSLSSPFLAISIAIPKMSSDPLILPNRLISLSKKDILSVIFKISFFCMSKILAISAK